jgi:diguanylate cyclase (GGDEF)-like protein
MGRCLDPVRLDRRLMARTAVVMYGGAGLAALIEYLLPGGPDFSVFPGLLALALAAVIAVVGRRLPRWGLASLGPIGVGLIAVAVATIPGPGDGAVYYLWPVLWMTFFFGWMGAASSVACVGLAHGLALVALPPGNASLDRWLDVVVTGAVVAGVTQVLAGRDDELFAKLIAEARTDQLTGLLNRRGFGERAAVELAHARRSGDSIAVVSFDVDHFKDVNDRWGHQVGDRVLAHLGRVLTGQSRDIDVVARVGGEEFVVLLPGCTAADADAYTWRVRQALRAPARDLPVVGVSAGVAAAAGPESMEGLLRNADAALYTAKRTGRNRTAAYEDETARLARTAAGHARSSGSVATAD